MLTSLKFFVGSESEESIFIIKGITSSCWTILGLFICFILAYQKLGTKFLTFFLVLSIVGVLGKALALANMKSDLNELIELMIVLPLFIWYQVASWNLRQLNKQITQPRVAVSSE